MALKEDRCDIRAEIDKAKAAAALIVVFERCAKAFGRVCRFDALPEPIRALARVL